MSRERLCALAALLLALVAAARVAGTWTIFSQTVDEDVHPRSGYEWLTGTLERTDSEHPPLARVLFALDTWLRGVPKEELLYRAEHYRRHLAGMRAGNLPFLFLAILIVYLWTRRLFGAPTAVVAVAFFTSLPPILGHAGLATTDLPATATTVAALYALWRWTESSRVFPAVVLGLAIGAGLLSKFSFVLFFGAGAIVILAVRRPRKLWQLTISAVIAAIVVWAGYRFTIGTLHKTRLTAFATSTLEHQAARYADAPGYDWVRPDLIERYRAFAEGTQTRTGYAGIDFVDWAKAAGYPSPLAGRSGSDTMAKAPPLPPLDAKSRILEPFRRAWQWIAVHVSLPAPLFLAGLERVAQHADLGHPSFLLGDYRAWGWWYYFPVILFYKTPLPFLALALLGMAFLVRREPALVLAPVLMLAVLIPSSINIGVRHAMPLYPLLAICAAFATVWLWRRHVLGRAGVAILLVWLAVSNVLAHPDYLAWFNEAAGGHPETIAVDSNLDWGQDLLRLKDELQRAKIERPYLAYFGSTRPGLHGIDAIPLPEDNRCRPGWIAISETKRVMERDRYSWLDAHEPVHRVGRSIRLYRVSACN